MDDGFWKYMALWVGLPFVLMIALIASCSIAEQNRMDEDGCMMVENVKTGNRRHCGKACTKEEEKTTYICNSGWLVKLH